MTQRPEAFGLKPGDSLELEIRIALRIPDQDLSQAYVLLSASPSYPNDAEAIVQSAVLSMVEALRALGGEASTASVETSLHCILGVQSGGELADP